MTVVTMALGGTPPNNTLNHHDPIQTALWHCVNNYAYADAIFLAERLLLTSTTSSNGNGGNGGSSDHQLLLHSREVDQSRLHVLATAYYRSGRKLEAYDTLTSHAKSPTQLSHKNRFLLATIAFDINKLHECERVLLSNPGGGASSSSATTTTATTGTGPSYKTNRGGASFSSAASSATTTTSGNGNSNNPVLEQIERSYVELSSFALKLFGRVCLATDRAPLARDALARALKLNPFLFDAFETLAKVDNNNRNNSGGRDLANRVFQPLSQSVDVLTNTTGLVVVTTSSSSSAEPLKHHQQTPSSGTTLLSTPPPAGQHQLSSSVLVPLSSSSMTNNAAVLRNNTRNTVLNLQQPHRTTNVHSSRNLFTSTPMSQSNYSVGGAIMSMSSSSSPSPSSSLLLLDNSMSSASAAQLLPISPILELYSSSPTITAAAGGTTATPSSSSVLQLMMMDPPRPKKQQQQTQQLSVRRSSRLHNSHHHTPTTTTTSSSASNNAATNLKENNKSSAAAAATTGSSPRTQKQQPSSAVTTNNRKSAASSTATAATAATTTSTTTTVGGEVASFLHAFKAAADPFLLVLRELGQAHLHVSRYECREALAILLQTTTTTAQAQQSTSSSNSSAISSSSSQQLTPPWVTATTARAYFELGLYERAVTYYSRLRGSSRHRLEGLEWFSTALWHLQREVELSALAQELLAEEENKKRPQTWIVLGNCFSLHKEHDHAIKFFKRAIQTSPVSAYAYTLLGHEYVQCEELEKALRSFRSASRLDHTHYNAWYGMGMIYYKQERFAQAEVYFKKAIALHPQNSVLLCHLGVVQNALGRTHASLATFTDALKLNNAPTDHNPLCKFHRASVLFAVNRLDEALQELEELKTIVPKESLVHFLVAKIHSKRGETHKALLHFSWATDLDPKGVNNHIKESIEPVLSRNNHSTGGDHTHNNNEDNNNAAEDQQPPPAVLLAATGGVVLVPSTTAAAAPPPAAVNNNNMAEME